MLEKEYICEKCDEIYILSEYSDFGNTKLCLSCDRHKKRYEMFDGEYVCIECGNTYEVSGNFSNEKLCPSCYEYEKTESTYNYLNYSCERYNCTYRGSFCGMCDGDIE